MKSRRALAILAVIVVMPFYLVFVGQSSVSVWWYATGTSTKAVIEECWNEKTGKSKGPTVCRGSWTLPDGTRRSGKIVGPGKRDVGATMTVRASKEHAAEPGLRLFGYPLLLLVPLFVLFVASRAERQRVATRAKSK
ncbi:hypothetical protein [Actinomadura sp. 9N407]|uniref:hypothetical protein n=1 Tax=Actinomadura sp. 9N407 TaxID=3375154 RepID=UPI0037B72D85